MDENKSSITIKCDTICVSGGWTPTVHLFTQSKGRLKYREFDGSFVPEESFQKTLCLGSCNGDYDLHKILDSLPSKVTNFLFNLLFTIHIYIYRITILKNFTKKFTSMKGKHKLLNHVN